MPFERRQNTDNYHVRIERVITGGENLLDRIQLGRVNTFEELITASNRTSEWLLAGQQDVARIYPDPAIAGTLSNRVQVDLENESHAAVIDSLRSIIEEQIGAVREILRQTRIHDGHP